MAGAMESQVTHYGEPFLFSEKGSTRATAYGFGNKSVTLDGKTHVVWLDAVARVCGRTYDHASKARGHPSHEVFHLMSLDRGASFECNQVSPTDDSTANWLPSISLAGPLQPVDKPVILYTRGDKGDGCSPITETEVYCVIVEDLG